MDVSRRMGAIAMKDKGSQREHAGFSLIEVLIVLVIISVVAAIAIIALQNAFDRAKQRGTMADMRTIGKAVEVYQTDTGHFPANGQTTAQLAALLRPTQTSVLPTEDHWSHTYVYTSDNVDSYSIESYGKDGLDGTQIDYSTRFQFDLDLILSNGLFTASPEN